MSTDGTTSPLAPFAGLTQPLADVEEQITQALAAPFNIAPENIPAGPMEVLTLFALGEPLPPLSLPPLPGLNGGTNGDTTNGTTARVRRRTVQRGRRTPPSRGGGGPQPGRGGGGGGGGSPAPTVRAI